MSFEFAQLNTGILTLGAFMRFLKSVLVPDMSNKFSRCGEGRFTLFTLVWSSSSMCVYMVLQRGHGFESSITDVTFMWFIL